MFGWVFFFGNGPFDWSITKNIMKIPFPQKQIYIFLHNHIKSYKCIDFYTYTV
jgi:hypothetical protein